MSTGVKVLDLTQSGRTILHRGAAWMAPMVRRWKP
jgi:hypothetical protein